ncbi:helix-turn-helix domain-containing protein [Streptomyces sp. NPDC059690]|uniref:helix-turn-helix domain-containing protein n=1 Tax=Streptomyces sp. NPDC059690 TaxID=3346907 RepID=UPI0036A13527
MTEKRNPLGPIGENVRVNVQRIREEQRLSLAELSRRLDAIGRKIPTLGLGRVESGERRVDADDLVALAEVLSVSPATLMLPPKDPGEPVKIAEKRSVPWATAWRWATGEAPLELRDDPDERSAQLWQWRLVNRPHKRLRPAATPDEFMISEFIEEDREGEKGEGPGR